MKIHTKRRERYTARAVILCCLLLPIAAATATDLLESPVKHVRNYSAYPIDKNSPLISRVQAIPDFLLKAWMKWDEKNDYRPYMPGEAEMRIIGQYLDMLPALNRSVMKERLLGIFFIDNLMGSGLTDWVVDDKKNIYTYMIFNPVTLKMDISDLITWKEETCFIRNDGTMRVRIDLEKSMNGFLYILLHESTHVVDYVMQITPYTEPDIRQFIRDSRNETEFTLQVWKDYRDTERPFPFRSGVTFYGFGKGPKINITDSPSIYDSLSESPFISLYGVQNWAEDLAEFLTFYHLTKKMGMDYTITVYRGEQVLHRSRPADNPYVKVRLPRMERFYYVSPARKTGN